MRWMDPFIDFGREIYLPWRILEGEHPGRDFIHPYGPLSVYFNAGVFALFGVSIRSLVLVNLAVFGGVVVSLHLLGKRAFGFWPAAVATAFAVPVFGFAHYAGVNNYTFLAPYAHEATHGMLLLLGLLLWLGRTGTSAWRSRTAHCITGALCGLLCLTKTEYVLVTALLAAAQIFRIRRLRPASPPAAGCLGPMALGFAVVFGVAWLALALATTPATALRTATNALLAPFAYAAYSQSTHVLHFLGADQLGENLYRVLFLGMSALLIIGGTGVGARAVARAGVRIGFRALLVVGLAALALVGVVGFDWIFCATTFPILLLAGAICVLRSRREETGEELHSERRWNQLFYLIAAIGMLARMAFDPTISHYGFFQAMLAGTWICAFLVGEWPRLMVPDAAIRKAYMGALAALFLGGAVKLTGRSLRFYRMKETTIGLGADAIRGFRPSVYPLVEMWEHARAFVAGSTAPAATVLVVPEGISLNYWTRRKHPLAITDVLPATLALNKRDVVADLSAVPPDFVVVVSREMAEFGFKAYGENEASGKALLDWVAMNYALVGHEGAAPFSPGGLGVWVLKHKQQ